MKNRHTNIRRAMGAPYDRRPRTTTDSCVSVYRLVCPSSSDLRAASSFLFGHRTIDELIVVRTLPPKEQETVVE